MNSIIVTMIWEMWRKGQWNLFVGFLGANIWPAVLFTAMYRQGVSFQDPSLITVHSTLILINLCVFLTMVISSQGSPSRLYTYPVPTSTLAACHLFPTMIFSGLEVLLSTALINSVFDVRWPVLSAALFAATAAGMIQATLWFTEKSAWLPLVIGAVSTGLGVWYHYRFSHRLLFVNPTDPFTMTIEWIMLAVGAVVSYGVGTFAMSRNRCGEPLGSLGIAAWVVRVLDFTPRERAPFRTPIEAQTWYEWRLKGWAIPATVVMGMIFGFVPWLIFNREPKELVAGFLAGGGLLSAVALVWAIIIGNVGRSDTMLEMGSFLASRPMKTADLARSILKMTARSVFLAWSLWAGTFLVASAILFASGLAPQPFFPATIQWWYFPLTLLGPWTVVSVFASFGLTGRSGLCAQMICLVLGLYVGGLCLSESVLAPAEKRTLELAVLVVCGLAFDIGTAWLFIKAWKQRMVDRWTSSAAIIVWGVLGTAVISTWIRSPTIPLAGCIFLTGLSALVVAPWAAAPLALAANRNR